ncbi:nucleotide-diphospho-sugar transferase, partial [Gorgonomyces haynaldii]
MSRIPRIIHQTWKTNNIPEQWEAPHQRCQDMHPEWQVKLWTDEQISAFVVQNYPELVSLFMSYRYPIQRVDAFRYLVLYHYGGVYIDMDVGCLKPLDPLLEHGAIIPKTEPFGYSNDVLFAPKQHPFFKHLIQELPRFNYWLFFPYLTVFYCTGPLFLTINYNRFPEDVSVLGIEEYAGPREVSYFNHYPGSTWHSWDAKLIFFL